MTDIDKQAITTPELALKLGIKVRTVHDAFWKKGSVQGWKPCGFVEGCWRSYVWSKGGDV